MITIKAESRGGVKYGGSSKLVVAGSYLVVDGFVWDGVSGSPVILTGDATIPADGFDKGTNNYLLAYVCQAIGSQWKCGCHT